MMAVNDNNLSDNEAARIFFICVFLAELILSLYLIYRQYLHIHTIYDVPLVIQRFDDGLYYEDDLDFSRSYNSDKLLQEAWQKFYVISLWILVLSLDGLPFIWGLTGDLNYLWPWFVDPIIGRNMTFAMICYAAYEFLMIPMYYRQIIRKAKYEQWNNSTEICYNYLINLVTILVPGGLATGLITWALMNLETTSVLTQVFILASLASVFILLYPFLEIWLLINEEENMLKLRRDSDIPMSRFSSILEARLHILCNRVGFPRNHVIIYPSGSTQTTAFYYGFLGFRRIIVFQGNEPNYNEYDDEEDLTTVALTPKEFEAVVAHELGHWYYNHSDQTYFFWHAIKISTVCLVYWLRSSQNILQMFHFPVSNNGHLEKGLIYVPGAVITYFVILRLYTSLFETLLKLHSHWIEYKADSYAAVALGYHKYFCKALIKLVLAQEAVFPAADKYYQLCYHNHPSLVHRLRLIHLHQFKLLRKRI